MPSDTTAQDQPPPSWVPPSGLPVLVEVFPGSRVVPIPPLGEALGRNFLADHGLTLPGVSRKHAGLSVGANGEGTIVDLGSDNGVFVDGQRISSPSKIVDGSLVRLGRSILFVFRPMFRGPRTPDAAWLPATHEHHALVSPFGLRALRGDLRRLREAKASRVLILGPTGAGKENVARAVAHELDRAKPYVAVNAAAIPKDLFESEMFGHARGSFTGATQRKGRLVEADGGAFFMDEIGALAGEHQTKLLRTLEDGRVQPVGGVEQKVRLLFIAATNEDLNDQVSSGRFRRDLLARFDRPWLKVPALADRPEDLLVIADEVLRVRDLRLDRDRVDIEAVERLALHPFPENVRGLRALLQEPHIADELPGLRMGAIEHVLGERKPSPDAEGLQRALEAAGWNVAKAARAVGMPVARFRRLMTKHGIRRPLDPGQ